MCHQHPDMVLTGSADAENYASSLVSESPVVKRIQRYQRKITDHYKSMFESVVMIGVAQGRFPADVLKICQLHVELPTPVGRNRKDEVDTDLKLMDKSLLSPQHVCARNDLQWDEEQELLASAKEAGWTNQMGVVPGERPAGPAGPEGAAGEEKPPETGNEPRREQANPYNALCPICNTPAINRCRCSLQHTQAHVDKGHGFHCANGHGWSGDIIATKDRNEPPAARP